MLSRERQQAPHATAEQMEYASRSHSQCGVWVHGSGVPGRGAPPAVSCTTVARPVSVAAPGPKEARTALVPLAKSKLRASLHGQSRVSTLSVVLDFAAARGFVFGPQSNFGKAPGRLVKKAFSPLSDQLYPSFKIPRDRRLTGTPSSS